ALARRKAIDAQYRKLLADVPGIRCLSDAGEKVANYAYFPVQVKDGFPISRDALYARLRENEIYARRYFYPLISEFPMYRGLPSARKDNLKSA
ncbi:DegT/DnrJ/EryC1/StrS family aminotransferase, partial [Arthrobacter sp. SIMBA_036]